jgi:hypothetical protein
MLTEAGFLVVFAPVHYCLAKKASSADLRQLQLGKLLRSFALGKKKPGNDLLSRSRSTIGAEGLNFRVRDGNGWTSSL